MSEQRLIDANRLKEDIKNGSDIRLSILKDQYPTIEAVPAVRGKWIKKETDGGALAICDSCKYPVSWWHKSKFCPECGSKNDGDT